MCLLIRLAIFDYDGTIADSRETIVACAAEALAPHGLAIDAEALLARVGLPLEAIFAELLPEQDATTQTELVAAYRARFGEVSARLTRLYPGMRQLLDRLREAGIRLAVATGKSTRGAEDALARDGLAHLFDAVVGSDAVPRPKPHPDMVERLLGKLGFEAGHSCVVGDTTYDMRMASAAGVRPWGVTWGCHGEDALREAGALAIARELADLHQLFFR
ncbi:MAG: HAD family hydrolase [Polyangiaceae bacterium]